MAIRWEDWMTSPLTTFLLLLITVVLWQLLNRSAAGAHLQRFHPWTPSRVFSVWFMCVFFGVFFLWFYL